ncbi:hypothetical protein QUA81_15050 [Microcoleus sp. F6_B4]
MSADIKSAIASAFKGAQWRWFYLSFALLCGSRHLSPLLLPTITAIVGKLNQVWEFPFTVRRSLFSAKLLQQACKETGYERSATKNNSSSDLALFLTTPKEVLVFLGKNSR